MASSWALNGMNRRHFLTMSLMGGVSTLSQSGCTSLDLSKNPSSNNRAIVPELDGRLTSSALIWTDKMLEAFRLQNTTTLDASRACAMAHLAGYMAITGESFGLFESQSLPSSINPNIAYGAAFSNALEEALGVSLSNDRRRFYAQLSDKTGRSESIQWGQTQAQRVIQWRTRDGSEAALSRHYSRVLPRRTDALKWSPTGPFYSAKGGPAFETFARGERPSWGLQKTWIIQSAKDHQAAPFPAAGSEEFKRQFEKIRALGGANSTERTPEQNEIALFWEDGLMGITVIGHFQLIAMQLLAQRQQSLDYDAELFALMSLALADAGIVAWHNKYRTDILRPETAIRYANSRFPNLAGLTQNSAWQSYIPTPSFPSYVSGHSTFGAAACGVMRAVFDTDNINLQSPAPDMVNWPTQLRGVKRTYSSLSQIAEENGMSREYGGVHWEADNIEGLRLGYAVADAAAKQRAAFSSLAKNHLRGNQL